MTPAEYHTNKAELFRNLDYYSISNDLFNYDKTIAEIGKLDAEYSEQCRKTTEV